MINANSFQSNTAPTFTAESTNELIWFQVKWVLILNFLDCQTYKAFSFFKKAVCKSDQDYLLLTHAGQSFFLFILKQVSKPSRLKPQYQKPSLKRKSVGTLTYGFN